MTSHHLPHIHNPTVDGRAAMRVMKGAFINVMARPQAEAISNVYVGR